MYAHTTGHANPAVNQLPGDRRAGHRRAGNRVASAAEAAEAAEAAGQATAVAPTGRQWRQGR